MTAFFHHQQKRLRASSLPPRQAAAASSDTLDVAAYSLTLMWPLSVRDRADGTMPGNSADTVCAAVEKAPGWTRIKRGLHHLRSSSTINSAAETITKEEYAEFVYFYPFVQTFLFGDKDHLRLYRRTDIDGLRVSYTVDKRQRTVTLTVPRLNLYVFSTGDVFLVTEVSVGDPSRDVDPSSDEDPSRTKQPLIEVIQKAGDGPEEITAFTLADAMILNERLRRAYPPFFFQDNSLDHSYSLDSVEWLSNGKPLQQVNASQRDFLLQAVPSQNPETPPRNPLYPHWRCLLPDLKPAGLRWRQVQDDRMPAVAAIALGRPDKISRPDWVRLANFDNPGKPWDYGYGEAFLETFEQDCCYDRFWQPTRDDRMTRYVSTGFAVTQVLKAGGLCSTFFHHQRSLYFNMALISHFQQAALQNLSDQMAHAMLKELASKDTTQIASIMRRMLEFTQVFWFTDVSNQLQARELFRLIRRPLGLEALYEQVSSEAREANAYLNRREDQRIAEATERFNRIAVAGVVVAGATGFLGMNVWVEGWRDQPGVLVFLLSLIFFAASAGVLWTLTRKEGFSLPGCFKSMPDVITTHPWRALGVPLALIALLALLSNKPPAETPAEPPTVLCSIVGAPFACPVHPSPPQAEK